MRWSNQVGRPHLEVGPLSKMRESGWTIVAGHTLIWADHGPIQGYWPDHGPHTLLGYLISYR